MNDIKMGIIRLVYMIVSLLGSFFSNIKAWHVLILSILLIATILFKYSIQKKKLFLLKKNKHLSQKLIETLNPSKGLERTLHDLLDVLRGIIEARGYFFYILDKNTNQFLLKAVKHADIDGEQESFSVIEEKKEKKEGYLPSVTLPNKALMSQPSIIKDGKVPLLELPVKGGRGLVRLGPIKELPRQYESVLKEYSNLLQPIINTVTEMDRLKDQLENHVVSNKALHNFNDVTRGFGGTLKMTMGLSMKMIGASGSGFLVYDGDKYDLLHVTGLDNETQNIFSKDTAGHSILKNLMENDEFRILTRSDQDFYKIPNYLAADDMELLIMINVYCPNSKGSALFWFNEVPNIEVHRLTALQMMTKRMGDLLEVQRMHEETANSYIDVLKMLVQTVDNLEPFTVGYSELMARFTGIIAAEMNLAKNEIQDIILAAYLSNIGLLGFSNDLLFKEGKYTDIEYETMKLHSEVGASIIEATIGNHNVATYIRHHHERMDGNGYPLGLKGNDIPIGSRIIAVVQTFLAKINGRKYRDPLPFEKALQLLKSASGTQLDADVVDALINWFKKKQQNPSRKGRSLGACWEMRCVPISICKNCPAFSQKDKNCWEVEGVHCAAHGNKCDTCFIYTEYLSRMKIKRD